MSVNPSDTLQLALTHARSGNLAEAEKLCEDLLAQATVETETRYFREWRKLASGRGDAIYPTATSTQVT
jgi:hypothetical protein